MIEATIFSADEAGELHGDQSFVVRYVSLLNHDTYGPPALVAPITSGASPTAKLGEEVLYVNTRLVPLFTLKRVEDG